MTYVVYLKLTNRCNLKCEHCYNSTGEQCDMDCHILRQTIQYIRSKSHDLRPSDEMVVIFHGGEPMLAGSTTIHSVIDDLSDLKNISFTITTNLVYELTDERLDLLKRISSYHNGSISTSYDYKIRFRDGQEQLWEQNIKTLLQNGIVVIPIVSMSKPLIEEVQPGELFSYFIGLDLHQINLERITKTGRAEDGILCPKNVDIDKWSFDAYVESKKLNVEVNIFRSIEDAVKAKTLTGCKMRMCQRLVTTINPNGTLSGCPNTANSETFGDVFNGIDNIKFNMSCCKEETKNGQCYMCRYFRYCNGECFQLSWDETGCPGFKRIMEYVSNER